MTTQNFELGDILSVTTGRLVSTSGEHPIDGVYKILDFITGESNFTHQLPRVSKEARPILLRQHPQLAEIDASDVNGDNWREWLNAQIAKFGATLPVETMAKGEHEHKKPISELVDMAGADRVVVVTL